MLVGDYFLDASVLSFTPRISSYQWHGLHNLNLGDMLRQRCYTSRGCNMHWLYIYSY